MTVPLPDPAPLIRARRLFPGGGNPALPDRIVEIGQGRITDIRPATAADARLGDIPETDILCPGFVDLQINGAGDRQFNHDPTPETLHRMAEAAREGGTALILPTFITAPGRDYVRAIEAVRDARAAGVPGLLGLHLEGPFLSPDRPGIHHPDAIRPLDAEDVAILTRAARMFPILLTVAPETVPGGVLSALAEVGVTVFAGHSAATADEIDAAEAAGLRGATHLFNAMTQMTSRAPGVAGAVMASDRLFAGVIADGHHVDWRTLRVACRAMPGRLFLVTDAMLTLAGTRTDFLLDGRLIRLGGGRLRDAEGRLAGAHVDMISCVRNVVTHCDVPLPLALDMASGIPARAMQLRAPMGQIALGGPAHLTCLTDDLEVRGVYVGDPVPG
jgi:N-acetylglucosamine-6-phosphate deacetylase